MALKIETDKQAIWLGTKYCWNSGHLQQVGLFFCASFTTISM